MSQSRRLSALEAVANVAAGVGVAYGTQLFAFPLFDIHVGHGTHAALTGIFTVASLVRSYALRRVFNRIKGQ